MSAIVNAAGSTGGHHEGVDAGGDSHSAAKTSAAPAASAAGPSSNHNLPLSPAPSINTWGTIGHLTPEQETALRSFESSAKQADIQVAKYTVETVQQCSLRFLRARSFDVPKALVLLSECVSKLAEMRASYWAEQTADECANCDVDALQNFYPHVQVGFDRFNRPVMFEHSGGMQPSVILQMSSKKNLINYHWWYMESKLDEKFTEAAARVAANAREGEAPPLPNISTCVVLDFKDLGMQHCSQRMLDQMKLYIGKQLFCILYCVLFSTVLLYCTAYWHATS